MKGLHNFLKGMAIGIATLVPGVSGGTMSIVLNVYDDLIHSISSFFNNWKKSSIFLLQIGAGAFAALLLFSRILESALSKFPFLMSFLFIGIILGGIPVLYKKSTKEKRNNKDFTFALLGFILVIAMSLKPSAVSTLATSNGLSSMIFLFFAGIIIAVALILPGISGSFLLLTLGLYDTTLNAINTLNIPFLIPLSLGVILGTLITTKIIENLLNKYPSKTYMLILGFVSGSLVAVFPGMPTGINMVYCLLSLIIGFFLIHSLTKREKI
ncbi:DUF368 domain-containing protein [Clostridium hydrogeniformans]|uniref:DUF368 domain-containing protein n=1 Tax=Clostridium hydrogeniformans TaxID=349933 RepID=UPI000484B7F0|nr:DUF368 domain-containing protein [Clostridium hydrogeniformans]